MTYDAREELLKEKSRLKREGKDCTEIEKRLISLDKITKKSKRPRINLA